jgi:hypothetical protein
MIFSKGMFIGLRSAPNSAGRKELRVPYSNKPLRSNLSSISFHFICFNLRSFMLRFLLEGALGH